MGSDADLLGRPVRNGCGAAVGVVVRVARARDGALLGIVVRQPDGREWEVDAEHIASLGEEVRLKGPREGFTLWPLPAMADPRGPALAPVGAPALATAARRR